MGLRKTPGSAHMAQCGSRSVCKSTCSSWSFPARKLFDRAASATLCPLKAWMWLGTGRASALDSSVMVGGGGLLTPTPPEGRSTSQLSHCLTTRLELWPRTIFCFRRKVLSSQCLQWCTPQPTSLCSHSPRIPLHCFCPRPPLTD